jgi:hypothetical protein
MSKTGPPRQFLIKYEKIGGERKMKKVKAITVFTLSALLLAITTVPAMAYVIDGDLSDWGVNPTLGDWVANPPATSVYANWAVGPFNTPSNHDPGLEECDIEAIYVDEDVNGPNLYFAIITSMPPGGFAYDCGGTPIQIIPGDLALDLNNDGTFEYGIKLTTQSYTDAVGVTIGEVFKNPGWERVATMCFQNNWPYVSNMVDNPGITKTGAAEIVYMGYSDWPFDNGKPNYVIEMRVPKSALGISSSGHVDLVATLSCINDVMKIGLDYTPIPEFTTIALPVCMILGLFYFFRRKRQTE